MSMKKIKVHVELMDEKKKSNMAAKKKRIAKIYVNRLMPRKIKV